LSRNAKPALALLVIAVIAGGGVSAGDNDSAPDYDLTRHRVEYAGPGRDVPAPDDVDEVLIGYFGPSDAAHPTGGDLWLATGLAIEEANAAGGLNGLPFRLVPVWSENPWGTGVAQVARIVYEDRVWAIIGSIDGAATHLAEQVVAKARLSLISPVSTDKTVNFANVAWMFSCLPADDRYADVLVRALRHGVGARPLTLISGIDHDSRQATAELLAALASEDLVPGYHFELDRGASDFVELAGEVAGSDAAAVVVIAGPAQSARLVVALREQRSDLLLFGGPSMERRAFLEIAGSAADAVRFPLLCNPSAESESFQRSFVAKFGREPDCVSAQTYDATWLLLDAIQRAGLNRARIRDAIEALSPWSGAAGAIEWDSIGRNRRNARLGTIVDGRIVPIAPTALGDHSRLVD
jgi:ABC-type branched-subunit amino acid transport system substrate-binding protein